MVENIGFRSTLVRLLSTAPMLVPNKDLADFKVINHGAMQYRRISWTINLIYSTTQDQLAKICEEIEAFIKSSDQFAENPRQDSFVKTDEFGASSIDIRILCYTEPLNLTDFTKVKQSLIFETIKIVRANGSSLLIHQRRFIWRIQKKILKIMTWCKRFLMNLNVLTLIQVVTIKLSVFNCFSSSLKALRAHQRVLQDQIF